MHRELRSIVLLAALWLVAQSAQAQFAFTYTGPDTLFVDESCTAMLDWGHPETPQAFPTVPGQVVISFEIFSISGGYMIGDPVPAGEIVTVFYQARDNMGHIVLFGFNLAFIDTIPPIFDPVTLPLDVTIDCGDDLQLPDVLFSDNCASDTTMVDLVFDETGAIDVCTGGELTRTWTLTDAFGNTAQYVQQITVTPDTIAPQITGMPVDGNAPCGNAMDAYTLWLEAQRTNFVAEDVGCGIMEIFDNAPGPAVLLGFCGEITVDFFATDSCQNTTSVCASFFVTNETSPTISMPASDAMADCSSGTPVLDFNAWLTNNGGADATDDCSIIMWSTDPPSPSLSDTCNGAINVTFIADDGCGNIAMTNANFFVQDTVPPTIQSEATNRIINCSALDFETELGMWLSTNGNAQASDICTDEDALSVHFEINGLQIDSSDVFAAFQDSIAGGCVDGIIVDGIIWNNVLALIEIEFVFTDVCGNSGSTFGIFGITDVVGPMFSTPPQDQLITCGSGQLDSIFTAWYQTAGNAEGEDDCGSIFYRGSPDLEIAFNLLQSALDTACGSGAFIEVAFYINDFCGNENPDSAMAMFGIADSIGPVLEALPLDFEFNCDSSAQLALETWLDTVGGAQASDLCGDIDWTFQWSSEGETLMGIPLAGPYPDLVSLDCDVSLQVTFIASDICDNAVSATAGFLFVDTIPPDIVIEQPVIIVACDSTPLIGSITVSDNCTSSPFVTFTDTIVTGNDTTACGQFSGTIKRTWIAMDECGNTTSETQMLQISDFEAPDFVAPADTLLACAGQPDPSVTGVPTQVTDNCDTDPFVTYQDQMTGSGCNFSISRLWIVTDACQNADSAIQIIALIDTIPPELESVPMDQVLVCDAGVDLDLEFDQWITSGAGVLLNDACGITSFFVAVPGTYTLGDTTTYPGVEPILPPLQECGASEDGTLLEVFADVVYYDLCGNAAFGTVRFAMVDENPPVLDYCPALGTEQVDSGTCSATFVLTPPVAIEHCFAQYDTISMQLTLPVTSAIPGDTITPVQPMLFTFSNIPQPPAAVLEPVILNIELKGVDADGAQEFFNIYDEFGVLLGQTELLTTECDTGQTALSPSSSLVDTWTQDGVIGITLDPNIPQGMGGEFAVNDICLGSTVTVSLSFVVNTPNALTYSYAVDGAERIMLDSFTQFILTLEAGSHQLVSYVADCSGNEDSCVTELIAFDTIPPEIICPVDILADGEGDGCEAIISLLLPVVSSSCGLSEPPTYYVTGVTVIPEKQFPAGADSVLEVFAIGLSQVTYLITDLLGNIDSCTFEVVVRDPTAPVAVCQDALVFVHPSGTVPLILQPDIIDGGSTDNCGIDTLIVLPAIFPCDSAGTEQFIELVVIDFSGNADTCSSIVRIEVQSLEPAFTVGICENDTLRLFANVPDAPGNPYTFSWSGPNAFVSNLENPVIPGAGSQASGTYVLIATGIGGCTSMGTVSVVIEDINAPDISTESGTVCAGDPVILQASGFNQQVTYNWYRGIPPDGLLLGTSLNPTFIDIPPVPGDYSYYVIVESDDCTSNPSQTIFVFVVTAPEASVNDLFIEVCQGETIILGTSVNDPGITFQWSGPNGFVSDEQFPPAITDAQEVHEGIYNLVILLGDCTSNIASTVVLVNPRPEQPLITGDSVYCEGGDLTLVVNNVEDADQYIWLHPNSSSIPTFGNSLTLSGIGQEVVGEWTVTAMLNDCASEPSAPFVVNVEESLIITTSNTGPVCHDDSVTLLVQMIPGATYLWTGPAGFSSSEPNPTLLAVAGNYMLETVSATGCMATSTTTVVVNDGPEITAISNTAGDCADGTQNLSFAVTLFPADNGSYSYSWSGPNGFTSTESLPVITGLSAEDNGVYALVVFQGNCPSDTVFTEVNVADTPDQPVVDGIINWCAGDDLIISVQDYSGDSVLYTWSTPQGIVEIWNDSILMIPGVGMTAEGIYTVVVTADGCPSATSDPLNIQIAPELAQPVVIANSFICEGDSLVLSTELVAGASYFWTGPNGFTSTAPVPVIYPAGQMTEGNYQVVIELGPCTSLVSESWFVEVKTRPAVPALEPFGGTVCLDDPGLITICLDEASVTPGADYIWINALTGDTLTESDSRCIDIEEFTSFSEGLNEIVVISTLDGCFSETSSPLAIEAVKFPNQLANAGLDRLFCLSDIIQLDAMTPLTGTGRWTSANGSVIFDNPANPDTEVEGLSEGENLLIWSLDFESCLAYTTDSIVIIIESSPVLEVDSVFVPFGMTVNFNVLINDLVPDNFMFDISENPQRGNVLHDGDGTLIYSPNIGFVGEDRIVYEVCSAVCPTQCDEVAVILQVGNENDCFVPTIFTPNQDGVNDLLTIPCLETDRYPENRIAVFNVWGDAVFEASPYENDWDGTREGKDLPVGTYYYVVDFGDSSPVRKGFLIIER